MDPRIHAPPLAPNRGWLNTDGPLTLAALRGNVVILDFWTTCCINCQHVLPVLRALEERRAGQPVRVVGIHSAKFEAEADAGHVADALARHGVTHPVVLDDAMAIWEQYAIRSWPTLVILRPDGTVAALTPGEPVLDELDAFVQTVLDEARAEGTLRIRPEPTPVPTSAPPATPASGPLRFPGKLAVAPDGRFAVADTGNHRVLLFSPEGTCVGAWGDGRPGFVDGASPRFCRPNGLTFGGGGLWVADTDNHAIRRVDFGSGEVTTVAGIGTMGVGYIQGALPAMEAPLRSPWDLVAVEDDLVIAMAGTHQLYLYDAQDQTIGPLAGSGREALQDGGVAQASFAQPSGLALAFPLLFVADSETSALRLVDLARQRVQTLVGRGLFDFGFADGPRGTALLQHPMGVGVSADGVVVADTYNSALRRVAPNGAVTTLCRAGLREPEDVKFHQGAWLVADTGNHRVVRIDPSGVHLGVVALTGAPILCD